MRSAIRCRATRHRSALINSTQGPSGHLRFDSERQHREDSPGGSTHIVSTVGDALTPPTIRPCWRRPRVDPVARPRRCPPRVLPWQVVTEPQSQCRLLAMLREQDCSEPLRWSSGKSLMRHEHRIAEHRQVEHPPGAQSGSRAAPMPGAALRPSWRRRRDTWILAERSSASAATAPARGDATEVRPSEEGAAGWIAHGRMSCSG